MDHFSSVVDSTVQSLNILLFRAVRWNKLHRRLHQSHSYRLRIVTVIFLPTDKRFYILGADDFYVMTQFLKLTLPVKCPGGRFDPNQTCRNICQRLEQFFSASAFRINRFAGLV